MSVPERLVSLDVAATRPAVGRPPLARVAAVFTASIDLKTPVRTPSDAAVWAGALRDTDAGSHAAFLLDRYRNVTAAWLTDAPDADAVLTYALSTDIRELAGRELVIVSAVEASRTGAGERRAFSGMVKRARRRNATLLDWVIAGRDKARSMRLAVEPGNDWPAAAVMPAWGR